MNTLHRLDTHSKIHNYEKKNDEFGKCDAPGIKS